MVNIETAILEFLIPSWWEVQVTVAAAVFVVVAYWFLTFGGHSGGGEGSNCDDRLLVSGDEIEEIDKTVSVNSRSPRLSRFVSIFSPLL